MPKTRTNWLILTTVVALLGGLFIWQTRPSLQQANPSGRVPAPQPGHPAPDFTLTTLSGETLTLSDLRGTPVVLNFWATWCGPCRSEMPAFEAVSEAYAGQVVFVGVNVAETPDAVQDFVDNVVGVTYPLPLDPDHAVADSYRVRAFPSTFFIDANGVVHETIFGAINRPTLEAKLAALIED